MAGADTVKQTDFDERVDVLPVSDPNFFSMSQRISLAQQELQLYKAIQRYTISKKHTEECEALGTENVEQLFMPEPPPPNPVTQWKMQTTQQVYLLSHSLTRPPNTHRGAPDFLR